MDDNKGLHENVNKPDDEDINTSEKNETNNTGVFLPIGIGLGVSLGIVFDNLAIGISLGVAFGLGIGPVISAINAKKKK